MMTLEQQIACSDCMADDVLDVANEHIEQAQANGATFTQTGEINLNGLGEAMARAVASTCFHKGEALAPMLEKVMTLLSQRGAYWLGELQASDLQPGQPLGL